MNTISTRKRVVQGLFRASLSFVGDTAWFNSNHRPVAFPLYERMSGALYSPYPTVSYKKWTAPSVAGPDASKLLKFEWVAEDGTVISTAGQYNVVPLAQIGYIPISIVGPEQSLNLLPAGLKRSIEDTPPTEGTWEVDIGMTTCVLWMTLTGNNLPS